MSALAFDHDGLCLSLVDTGGAGHPVIFQHGLLGDAAQAAEVLPGDAAEVLPGGAAVRRLTLECRGHGRSEAGDPAALGIARFAADVAAAAASRGIERAIVGGISMGAAIGLRLAVTRPDLVEALVLARPAWVDRAAPANLAPLREVGALLARHSPETARALFLASATHATLAVEAPDNLASLLGFFERPDPATTSALLLAITADGPGVTEAEIAAIAVPTLVLSTERDLVHPVGHAQRLARLVPRATLVAITPKATDLARYVAEFRGALVRFIAAVTAGRPA